MACGSVSQRLVSPWPEAEDSLAVRKLSLWPSGIGQIEAGIGQSQASSPCVFLGTAPSGDVLAG